MVASRREPTWWSWWWRSRLSSWATFVSGSGIPAEQRWTPLALSHCPRRADSRREHHCHHRAEQRGAPPRSLGSRSQRPRTRICKRPRAEGKDVAAWSSLWHARTSVGSCSLTTTVATRLGGFSSKNHLTGSGSRVEIHILCIKGRELYVVCNQ